MRAVMLFLSRRLSGDRRSRNGFFVWHRDGRGRRRFKLGRHLILAAYFRRLSGRADSGTVGGVHRGLGTADRRYSIAVFIEGRIGAEPRAPCNESAGEKKTNEQSWHIHSLKDAGDSTSLGRACQDAL